MKKEKISLILNCLIVFLVIIGVIFMFLNIRFMPDKALLSVSNFGMLKFFTVDSNILIGIVSLVLGIYEFMFLNNKIKNIPNYVYILKFIGVSSVTLTFLTTLLFLSPMYGFYAMYNNSNLLFHLVIPGLSLISYLFFEKYNSRYKYAILGIVPMIIYSVYYCIMILIHLNSGGLTFKYDFYGFLQGNLSNIFIVIPIIYIFSYFISISLIVLNKIINK